MRFYILLMMFVAALVRAESQEDLWDQFATRVAMDAIYEKGIDVSHYNKDVNWEKVKAAGITFAIAKATEGNHYQDAYFLQNWRGMRRNNIKASVYHYLRGAQSAESQVENIKRVLQSCDFDADKDVIAVDIEKRYNLEVSPEDMADTLHGVLVGLNSTFRHIYIYTYPSYWEESVAWRRHNFGQYKLWIAHYTEADSPKIPETWKHQGFVWWQHSEHGRVDGVTGNVDLNRAKRTLDDALQKADEILSPLTN